MIRTSTLSGINRIASSSGQCVCKTVEKVIKYIGDSGDKSQWVEWRNRKLRIRTEEQLICLDCESSVCQCCRSS